MVVLLSADGSSKLANSDSDPPPFGEAESGAIIKGNGGELPSKRRSKYTGDGYKITP